MKRALFTVVDRSGECECVKGVKSSGRRGSWARQGKRDSITVELYTQSGLHSFDRRFKCRLGGFERGFAWEMNSSEGDSVSYRNIRRSRRGRSSMGGKRHGQG